MSARQVKFEKDYVFINMQLCVLLYYVWCGFIKSKTDF